MHYFISFKFTGHSVIRLPPYHCQYNPIELIWAQAKGYVARNNKFKGLKATEDLLKEGLQLVTPIDWELAVEHAKKICASDWEKEKIIETHVEEMIIRLGEDSSSSEDDEDTETAEDVDCSD